MKITAVNTVLLTGPCTNDPYLSEARKRRSAAFVEILTDTEITGLGETYAGYFIPEIVPEIVKFFEPILVGQNPEEIDLLWKRMYHCGNFWCRTGVGLQVLSAIEAALWDIRGKCERMPVYQLLSEVRRDSLPCYATGGRQTIRLRSSTGSLSTTVRSALRRQRSERDSLKRDGRAPRGYRRRRPRLSTRR